MVATNVIGYLITDSNVPIIESPALGKVLYHSFDQPFKFLILEKMLIIERTVSLINNQ